MEPGESSLQLMLRYKLARFNPQRGKNWRLDLEWFTSKNHQGFSDSKVWGHISKAWKNLAKNIYQLPPRTRKELFHSNIWWSDGVELLKDVFSYSRGLELYRKGIRRIDNVWDSNCKDFLTWEVAQHKFNLTAGESQELGEITNKLSEKWRRKLEEDSDITYPGMWLGLYVEGQEVTHLWLDMVRNLRPLVYNFTILAFLFRPRVTPWELTLGVLESGSTLLERLKVTFMRLKSCSPIEAQRKMGRKKGRRLYSFTAKLPLSFGTRIDGDEETEVNS